MSKTTPATLALQKAGVAFTFATYAYDPDVDRIGLAAAEALGVAPAFVFKTLMAEVDGEPACVVLPSDREVSMKKLAAAIGGKSAQMLKPDAAERLTGYKVGGISPFGQKRRVPTVLEATALALPAIFLNGGQRGLQIRVAPNDALKALGAIAADVLAER
jgi:Cys-tRNA(Pro)/Cys-tRNA(Cys) deacylase